MIFAIVRFGVARKDHGIVDCSQPNPVVKWPNGFDWRLDDEQTGSSRARPVLNRQVRLNATL
jgi:hypothetical protein